MATSQNTQQTLSQFNDELEKINQRIIDLGGDLGENLVEKFTKAVIEAKKIKDPLNEVESISKKISEAAEDKVLLENKLKILSLDYSKAARQGNEEEIRRLLTKKLQLKAALDLNSSLQEEYNKLLNISNEENKITSEKKKQNELLDLTKNKLKSIYGGIKDMLKIGSIFDMILKGITTANETSVNISKNFGYGAIKADTMVMKMQGMALASDQTNMTLKNIGEAMSQLGTTTGYFAEYSADTLETQIMLTKQLGLSGEEAAHIYEMSVLTGKSSSKVNDEMLGAFVNARNTAKVGVSMKQVFAEAAKVSGQLQATFAGNPAKITEAIVKVKALGTTLEQTKNQGDKLLDFASSLESELQAELLTGKQLNLERARAAALSGDQVALAEELNKNIGTYDDFSKMNVLQQKALANAVGLTADQLAEQLKKQKLAQESGKSLAEITKEEAEAAEKRKTIQEKYNNIVEKLQDVIGSIGTLLSPIVEMFTFIADHSWIIYTALGVMLLAKLPSLVKGFKDMGSSIMDMAKNAKGNLMKLFSKEGRASLLGGGEKKPEVPATSEAGGAGKGGGLMDKFKGMNTKDMIQGAAAILILSAALYVAAKAFQEFAIVKWEDVGKGILGIAALAGIAFLLGKAEGDMIAGALAVAILGVALIPFAYAMSLIAGLSWEAIGAAIVGLVAFGAAVFALGTIMMTGVGAIIFGAGILAIIALGGAMMVLGAGLQVVASAGTGITALFKSLTELDITKLTAIAPALLSIGEGIMALGAGSIMAGIGGLLGGSPVEIIRGIAEQGDGIQKAATGLQVMAGALTQVASALSAIDVSKLEALSDFSEKMSIGSVVSGITDLITSPIKAIGGAIESSPGGTDNSAMVTAINEVRDAVNKLYNKNQSIHIDGKQVGTTLTQGSTKTA